MFYSIYESKTNIFLYSKHSESSMKKRKQVKTKQHTAIYVLSVIVVLLLILTAVRILERDISIQKNFTIASAPINISFYDYSYEYLFPLFDELNEQLVTIEHKPRQEFLRRAVTREKYMHTRWNDSFIGATINFNYSRTRLYVEGRRIDSSFDLNLLYQWYSYDIDRGVYVETPGPHNKLYIPFSKANIRFYTEIDEYYLDDKSYRAFCELLESVDTEPLSQFTVQMIHEGIESIDAFEPETQELFLDIYGIAVAELYREHFFNTSRYHDMHKGIFFATLMEEYLRNGGPFVYRDADRLIIRNIGCWNILNNVIRNRQHLRATFDVLEGYLETQNITIDLYSLEYEHDIFSYIAQEAENIYRYTITDYCSDKNCIDEILQN